jgi:hypothetical protein
MNPGSVLVAFQRKKKMQVSGIRKRGQKYQGRSPM